MRVFLPAGFIPNGTAERSPLRESYVTVSSAVNKMLSDTIGARLAIILPRYEAEQYVPRLHYCKAHWTPKKGKPSGRPLGDLTYVDGTALCTDATAEEAIAYYGEIVHPTIQDIAAMASLYVAEKADSGKDVVKQHTAHSYKSHSYKHFSRGNPQNKIRSNL